MHAGQIHTPVNTFRQWLEFTRTCAKRLKRYNRPARVRGAFGCRASAILDL
jgi:hypothetical protein